MKAREARGLMKNGGLSNINEFYSQVAEAAKRNKSSIVILQDDFHWSDIAKIVDEDGYKLRQFEEEGFLKYRISW